MNQYIFTNNTTDKPIIGIVICGIQDGRQFVSDAYISAVLDAGGLPVILPCTVQSITYDSFHSQSYKNDFYFYYTKICDGFLFCGGNDITPLLFSEEPLTDRGQTDIRTDLFHLNLMRHIVSLNRPILAICRGMQVLNIALGGTIYQDLSLRKNQTLTHMQPSSDRSDISHTINILPDSILSRVLKNSMLCNIRQNSAYVNSFHHQCIHTLGMDLKVTASATDGVIEAIESTVHPFVLGVQWHPECMYRTYPTMKNIFTEFIQASCR